MTELNQTRGIEPGVPSGSEGCSPRGKKVATVFGALCALMAYVIVGVATPALAASRSTPAALENWYQQSGHGVAEEFLADGQRLDAANASTTARVARQDCGDFKRDALTASMRTPPPQPVLKKEYRYFLLAAVKSFTECMTGIKSSNGAQVFEGVQGGAQAVGAAVKIIKGAETGHVVSVRPSSVDLKPAVPASVLIPQCQSDFKVLEVAVEAYDAENNANPVPPAPWSAATYTHNFTPLRTSKNGGPFMQSTFDPTHYVLEYDSSGNVWVEPPGQYDTSYNPADGSSNACAAAVK
jgi:hypothetical protein